MKKILSTAWLQVVLVFIVIAILPPVACKRDKDTSFPNNEHSLSKVLKIKGWWQSLQRNEQANSTEVLSRVPDSLPIQSYWRGQFHNGIPKWNEAQVFTINEETIYQIPFRFPDNLVMMNEKPDASPQFYITVKPGSNEATKPSQTYLIVKERPGAANVAEIMCVVLNNTYIEELDSLGSEYPTITIENVYPSTPNLGAFSGSVKFYDLDGVQLLEEGYNNGSIVDYVQYGPCNYPIRPQPGLPTTRTYSVCTWTYVYQQNCGPDAGCTDWELIAIMFNGCQTVIFPDSPPINLGSSGDGTNTTGGGGHYPPPPPVQSYSVRPGARLCGNYKWKNVGDAIYCQIRNLSATFAPNNPGEGVPQTFTLGLTCIHFPKWYVSQMGWDVTEFINRAFNKAADRIQHEMNTGSLPLPPTIAIYQPKFEEYMEFYLKHHPNGSYHENATIIFRNGCDGPIPISEPKWCYPVE